nr:hypothetical protein [Nitrosomonas sp. Nm34]
MCIAGEIWILLNRQRTLQQYLGQRRIKYEREKE